MSAALIWEWILKSLILILFLTLAFAYTTFYERKLLARIQARVGPNRVGPKGLFQPIADAVKAFFKEELEPAGSEKLIFVLAPVITVVPALIVLAVVPWGTSVTIGGREIALSLTDVNVGVLYITAVTSISVYGITLAGWSSNNKYSLLGGVRSAAQMISYELALGLSFIGPVIIAGSLSIFEIVKAQSNVWFIFLQPVAFIIYFISSLAEINRAPFDLPEAEPELTGGYLTEYSGMKFALFYMSEYIKMITVSVIGASLFLGGFRGPGVDLYPWLGPIYLLIKVFLWLFVIIWIRGTLPRIRYDRLMALGWKVLFPVALLNVIVTAGVVVLVGG
ncbi:MAG: NADH-quinone oxidoreductase subunit NuoH [Anaerolineaceae bacterium]